MLRRVPHYLKENKVGEYPQQAIFFDTETDSLQIDENTVQPVLRMGKACYIRKHRDGKWTDEDWITFYDKESFWKWVVSKSRKKTKLYLFCHNTNFDLPVLDVFAQIPALGFKLKSAIIDGPPTILTFRSDCSTIIILDTLNFFRMSLASLGSEIGLSKMEMPEVNESSADWEMYAQRDVEIIKQAMINWWDYLQRESMGSFAPTLAGQSMRLYRHKYMRHKVFLDNNDDALRVSREGYYGGRVECFYIGKYKGEFTLLDINSMYPSVMAEYSFPSKLVAYARYATAQDLAIWLRKYSVAAKVLLHTNSSFAPYRANSKLTFPLGTFETTLNTPELLYALEREQIVKVIEVAVYQHDPLFRDMMTEMMAIKSLAGANGEKIREFIYKKLINSFYGKWGQSGWKWQELRNIADMSCQTWTEIDADTGIVSKYRQIAGLMQRLETKQESGESFPAIAAHVTSYARMKLWRLIEQAGRENVYYCDTDSLLVNPIGRSQLTEHIDKHRPGALKVVSEHDDIEIWGAKDYRFGDKSKTKGVRKNATWLDSNRVSQEQWSGLKGLIQRGTLDKPFIRRIEKHLSRTYDKGQVQHDGLVLPHLIPPAHVR